MSFHFTRVVRSGVAGSHSGVFQICKKVPDHFLEHLCLCGMPVQVSVPAVPRALST